MAAEHAELSKAIATDFNPRTAKRIGDLSSVTNALGRWEEASNVRKTDLLFAKRVKISF